MDRLPQEASRSAYTQRILEIVSNIRKQKEEITKVRAGRVPGWGGGSLGGAGGGPRGHSSPCPLSDPDGHQAPAEGHQQPDGEAGPHLRCDGRDGFQGNTFRPPPSGGDQTPNLLFTAVQDAKKDESVRKSYKYLAALHEVRTRDRLEFRADPSDAS